MNIDRDLFSVLEARSTPRCYLWSDRASGLRAVAVLDDVTLGPCAGGTRLRAYPSVAAAVDDAAALARAMTVKCALGGVDAGGGKIVVMDHPGLDRTAAFHRLGQFVDELGGRLRTAGDYGTNEADIAIMAEHSEYVYVDEAGLLDAVARGLVGCIRACVQVAGKSAADPDAPLSGLRIAIQGCGGIGGQAARAFAAAGASLVLADIDPARVRELADELGAEQCATDDILAADVDIVSPCAIGGVLTEDVAGQVRAFAVCGAANNILATPAAERVLMDRGVLFVPDVVASAGAVVDGVGDRIMGLADRGPLIDRLGETAFRLLLDSQTTGKTASELAAEQAWARIRAVAKRSDSP